MGFLSISLAGISSSPAENSNISFGVTIVLEILPADFRSEPDIPESILNVTSHYTLETGY